MLTIEEILTIDSGDAFERTALELFAFQAERCLSLIHISEPTRPY